ncbi:MAG TPA: hypothetical protein VIG72_06455 [Pontibacter sp.]
MAFIKNLLILSALAGLSAGALRYFTGHALLHPHIWYILVFFIIVTAIAFYVTRLGVSYDPDNFQLYHFASMGFRMLLSIMVIFLYIYFNKDGRLQFVFNFFVLYFVFTGFEIYSILANFAPQLKKQNEQ